MRAAAREIRSMRTVAMRYAMAHHAVTGYGLEARLRLTSEGSLVRAQLRPPGQRVFGSARTVQLYRDGVKPLAEQVGARPPAGSEVRTVPIDSADKLPSNFTRLRPGRFGHGLVSLGRRR